MTPDDRTVVALGRRIPRLEGGSEIGSIFGTLIRGGAGVLDCGATDSIMSVCGGFSAGVPMVCGCSQLVSGEGIEAPRYWMQVLGWIRG